MLFAGGAVIGLLVPKAAGFIAWAVPGGPASLSVIVGLPVEPFALPTPAWAWIVLALGFLVHGVAAWRDRAGALRT